ncbi:unnamed protein product [Microthlaspi erraticum]|uniref:Uncharacterized protein n=1 Tax=Microthlaspi erraticum TaxID=1685480 RepID=A0A6D2IKA9_9BRAS|nr:unnamed protein product [Microthlaspi erraticum]
MRIEDTSYGNSKHLGSIYNRLQALEGSSHANTRERGVQHPTTLPFIAMPSQEEALLKSMRTMKKKKESMRNNLNDEDEEQSIDINASPKQSKDTPSPS